MQLDRENGCCLGVLAGIANWLNVPVALVRVVFIICALAWPPFIAGYFILYFCLDRDFTPDKVRDYFSTSATAAHFRQLDYRKAIYRNQRNRRIAGVCSGIADYLEVSAFSVRLVTLLSLFVFGPFTFWAYIICWFVFDPDPYYDSGEQYERRQARRQRRQEKSQRHAERRAQRQARRRARAVRKGYRNEHEHAHDEPMPADDYAADSLEHDASFYTKSECTEVFSELESRLREIEAFMTSKRFRLHCQINRI